MIRFIAPIAALMLAGCATTAPGIDIQTVYVDRPTVVACVKRSDIPPEPAKTGKLPDDARVASDVLAAALTDVRLWGRRLGALLAGCAGRAD